MSEPASAGREKREKKQVEAFTIEVKEKDDDFKIEQGAGEKLAEIENVVFKIGKFDSASDELKTLHRLCFGRAGQKTKVKRNLREFSGFVFENVKAEKEKKAAVLNKTSTSTKLLKGMLDVCDLSPSGTKAQLVERLLDFLEKPEASGKRSLVEKAGEKRKLAEKKKEKAVKKAGKKPAKGKGKKEVKVKRPPSAYILYCNSRREKVTGENPGASMIEITKILAQKWKDISDERKAKYEAQAKELKAEYDAKMAKTEEPKAKKAKTAPKAKEAEEEEEEEEAEEEEEEGGDEGGDDEEEEKEEEEEEAKEEEEEKEEEVAEEKEAKKDDAMEE